MTTHSRAALERVFAQAADAALVVDEPGTEIARAPHTRPGTVRREL